MSNKGINVLSLFDGMSCGRIALERAGIEVDNYFSSEVDKYAIQIANKNYLQDTSNRLGDVTKIDTSKLPKIDLLIGGSPCQSFSFAGKQKGMSTKENIEIITLEQYLELKSSGFEFEGQSYLFWEFMRILKEVKPKYFLLENVKMSKKWKDVLSQAIGVEPVLINSSLVSAQNRERLYWSNTPSITQPIDRNIKFTDIQEYLPMRDLKPFMYGYYGNTRRVDKCKKLSAKKSNCCTTSKTHTNQYYLNDDKTKMRNLSVNEYERLQTLEDNYTEGVPETQRYKMIGNGWTIDVITHIFKGLKGIV